MENKKRCAFLMSSCDSYEDLWHPQIEEKTEETQE